MIQESVEALKASGAGWGYLSAGVGAGIAVIGGALGLGKIAAEAADGMARQPEAADNIKGLAILVAAMFEGATLFGIVVCLLLALNT